MDVSVTVSCRPNQVWQISTDYKQTVGSILRGLVHVDSKQRTLTRGISSLEDPPQYHEPAVPPNQTFTISHATHLL